MKLLKGDVYMLLSTYYAKLQKISKKYNDVPKLGISLSVPKFFLSLPESYHCKSLAPTPELLNAYKSGKIDWQGYVEWFKRLMKTSMRNSLNKLIDVVKNTDVIIVCYEKDVNFCHRGLIGKYIQEHGIEWREIK